jgi:hypothetical protein
VNLFHTQHCREDIITLTDKMDSHYGNYCRTPSKWFDWGRVLRRFREFLIWRHFSLTSMKNIHTWKIKNLCSLTDVTENLYELKWEIARQSNNYNVLYHVHVDCTVQKCIWNTLLTCSELEIHHIILGQKVTRTGMWLGFIE